MVTNQLDSEGESILRLVDEIKKDEIVADIGPETARRHASLLAGAETILWNGTNGSVRIHSIWRRYACRR